MFDLISSILIAQVQVRDCIRVDSKIYCAEQAEEVQQRQSEPQPQQSHEIEDNTASKPIPDYQLTTPILSDERYAEVVFGYSSVWEHNNCTDALLKLLEGSNWKEAEDPRCAAMVKDLFGTDFAPGTQTAKDIFIMQNAYARHFMKLPSPYLPGLNERIKKYVGLDMSQ